MEVLYSEVSDDSVLNQDYLYFLVVEKVTVMPNFLISSGYSAVSLFAR